MLDEYVKATPVVVLDTSVLVECPLLFPDEEGKWAGHQVASMNLHGKNLVVPLVAVRELSIIAKQICCNSGRASEALRRLRHCIGKQNASLQQAYNLGVSTKLPDGRRVSLMPVPAWFAMGVPFQPTEDDLGGQIVLTALAVVHLRELEDSPLEQPHKPALVNDQRRLDAVPRDVTLLTNDAGRALCAAAHGIPTEEYYHNPRDCIVEPSGYTKRPG